MRIQRPVDRDTIAGADSEEVRLGVSCGLNRLRGGLAAAAWNIRCTGRLLGNPNAFLAATEKMGGLAVDQASIQAPTADMEAGDFIT